MSSTAPSNTPGGLKGIIQKTGKFFYAQGVWAYSAAKVGYRYGGQIAFAVATTSMITLMPLLFEIARESQVSFSPSVCWEAHMVRLSSFVLITPDSPFSFCSDALRLTVLHPCLLLGQ